MHGAQTAPCQPRFLLPQGPGFPFILGLIGGAVQFSCAWQGGHLPHLPIARFGQADEVPIRPMQHPKCHGGVEDSS